jgi:hypothetical protein
MVSSSCPTAAPGVVRRNIGGEIILVPTRANVANFRNVFLLSRVGAFLWEKLDGKRDRDELCRLVREQFAVPDGHEVAADVDAFLGALSQRGLLS